MQWAGFSAEHGAWLLSLHDAYLELRLTIMRERGLVLLYMPKYGLEIG